MSVGKNLIKKKKERKAQLKSTLVSIYNWGEGISHRFSSYMKKEPITQRRMCFPFPMSANFLGHCSAIWRLLHWKMISLSRTLEEARPARLGACQSLGPLSATRTRTGTHSPTAAKQPPAKSTPGKPVSPHRQRPTSEQRGRLEAVTVFISCSQIEGEERKRRRGTHFQRGKSGRAELEFPATLSALPLCSWQVIWKMKMPLNGFHSVVKSNFKAGGIQRELKLLALWLGLLSVQLVRRP